jgi:enoyl-CoA hydratase/carnithine racemase
MYTALPRTTAAYLTLCNGRLTAQECYAQAIVNKVVPRENLMAAAEEMAEMFDEDRVSHQHGSAEPEAD